MLFYRRNIKLTGALAQKIHDCVECLILNCGVDTFLFGTLNTFDRFCLKIVSEFKKQYPKIKKIAYTCRNEKYTLESEIRSLKTSNLMKSQMKNIAFDEIYDYEDKYNSGKGDYVERNKAMIDDSDYCLFYYDKNYSLPIIKKGDKLCQVKSGTAIAYKYANSKNKAIKNFYEG